MKLLELLSLACANNATDLHLSTNLPPLIRIDGELKKISSSILTNEAIYYLLQECMDESDFKQLRKKHEIDFAFEQKNLARFRANVFRHQQGIAAAFRIISHTIPNLVKLNLPPVLNKITKYSNGLVLITGATGSGKSSTLAALINAINETQSKHIITIEDPIEFIHISNHCLINQRQVKSNTLSFEKALYAALRADPDIIVLGELRDLSTIRLALTAAETGHLVLATLHTTSAAKAINRIVDCFPGNEKNLIRNLLSESLQAVICQKLIKKIHGGRIAAIELMLATPAIRNLIREDKIAQIYSTIQTSRNIGMQTLTQHLQELIRAKLISAENLEALNESIKV